MPQSPPTSSFDEVLRTIAPVSGWLTDAQARRLWDAASEVVSPAQIVEIGSFQGRSTIVLASAAAEGVDVVAIDPHAGTDRGPQEIAGYEDEAEGDHRAFNENLARAGVRDRVRHIRAFSSTALGEVEGPIDLLFIDGAHRFGPARDDIERWGERVLPGSTILIHDAWSSVGVTLAILRTLAFGREFRYVGRSGSLAEYRREPVDGRDRRANVARQLGELGWFARNVAIKTLIVAHLGRLTRFLGHDGTNWPY